MRAIRFSRYGPADVLELVDTPDPTPGSGECLVRVRASSINPLDFRIRAGLLKLFIRVKLPFILGYDVSGEVVKGGERFRPGDEVFAMTHYLAGGCHAELVAVPEDFLARKPESMSHTDAAAVPLAALTALQGLRDHGGLAAGRHALVIGGSGGVGHYAVQIAKALGARVTAVCGPTNVEMVRGLGADRVVDYRAEDFRQTGETYDVVFDAVAKHSYGACAPQLTERGRYISTLPSPGLVLRMLFLRFHSRRRAHAMTVHPRGADLEFLAGLADEGKLRSVVEKVYPLAEARAAHERGETGRVAGKLVLEVV